VLVYHLIFSGLFIIGASWIELEGGEKQLRCVDGERVEARYYPDKHGGWSDWHSEGLDLQTLRASATLVDAVISRCRRPS
jgi:hypothetical protein